MNRQSSLKQVLAPVQRKSILISQTGNAHLAVIEESHEHCRSNTSQQSQHSEEELKKLTPRHDSPVTEKDLEFMRKNSSPFMVAKTPLDPAMTNSISSAYSKKHLNKDFARIEPRMVREKSLALNLSDTITKCDQVMSSLKERDSIVRLSSNVPSWITRDRPIIENLNEETENISSSDDEE